MLPVRPQVVPNVSQSEIMEKRRKERDALLKRMNQLTAKAEKNLEKLAQLTS